MRVAVLVVATACISVASRTAIGLAFGLTAALFGVFFSGYFGAAAPVVLLVVAFGPAIGFGVFALARMVAMSARLDQRLLDEIGVGGDVLSSSPELDHLITGIAIAAGIPEPRGVIVERDVPNAFAIGTKPAESTIGVTRGLMEQLSRAQVEAVVALLAVQIASRDIALTTWMIELADDSVVTLEDANERAGPIVAWDVALLRAVTWPARVCAESVERYLLVGLGKRRDRAAVLYTRNPRALLDALVALRADQSEVTPASRGTAPLWVEVPLQPFAGRRSDDRVRDALTLDDRITALHCARSRACLTRSSYVRASRGTRPRNASRTQSAGVA